MALDGSTSDSSKQDSGAIDPGGQNLKISRDHAFFLRVARGNGVQAALIKSSAIKLAESQKLLAEIGDLLRR